VNLLKDRLVQYEEVLVGLHRLGCRIKSNHQGKEEGIKASLNSSSSPHLVDSELVNYSKFSELVNFFEEQESYKQQLLEQCKSLDKELIDMQSTMGELKSRHKQSEDEMKNKVKQVQDAVKTDSERNKLLNERGRKEEERLKQQVDSLRRQMEDLNQQKEMLLKEADERFKDELSLKQTITELREALKEAEDDREKAAAISRLQPVKAAGKGPKAVLSADDRVSGGLTDGKQTVSKSDGNGRKNTKGSELCGNREVRWEDMRQHLSSQVNIYLDLQTKLSTDTFEVHCYDSDRHEPVEINLLLEVEKILDGIEDNFQQRS
jgi:DNA repair exonuclease SbcCD ATPase subunit